MLMFAKTKKTTNRKKKENRSKLICTHSIVLLKNCSTPLIFVLSASQMAFLISLNSPCRGFF